MVRSLVYPENYPGKTGKFNYTKPNAEKLYGKEMRAIDELSKKYNMGQGRVGTASERNKYSIAPIYRASDPSMIGGYNQQQFQQPIIEQQSSHHDFTTQ